MLVHVVALLGTLHRIPQSQVLEMIRWTIQSRSRIESPSSLKLFHRKITKDGIVCQATTSTPIQPPASGILPLTPGLGPENSNRTGC